MADPIVDEALHLQEAGHLFPPGVTHEWACTTCPRVQMHVETNEDMAALWWHLTEDHGLGKSSLHGNPFNMHWAAAMGGLCRRDYAPADRYYAGLDDAPAEPDVIEGGTAMSARPAWPLAAMLHDTYCDVDACDHGVRVEDLYAAETILASDWLATREREAAEKALRDAAKETCVTGRCGTNRHVLDCQTPVLLARADALRSTGLDDA